MEKVYTVIVLICLSLSVKAQITKNTWLLGSQLSFNSQKRTGDQPKDYKLGIVGVRAGRAIKDNVVAGINFTFATVKQSTSYNSVETTYEDKTFSYGAFYRQYVPLAKGFYAFGELDLAYLTGRGKEYYDAPGFG